MTGVTWPYSMKAFSVSRSGVSEVRSYIRNQERHHATMSFQDEFRLLLERHGIRGSRVRVGVRMRNGRFAAHAWVEYGDRVLGDNEAHVGSFVELSEVHLVDAR